MPPLHSVYCSGSLEIDLGQRELRAQGRPIPIGSRAFEIIAVLAEAEGDLVTKDDLFGRVWPGAVVEENTLQVHISAVRKALGPHRGVLKTSFGRGYRLAGAWSIRPTHIAEPDAGPRVATGSDDLAPGNVPLHGSNIVGREDAIKDVLARLSAYRVVTLTGAGGIGKTRLALEVARRLHPYYDGKIYLAEFGSLQDATLVPSVLANVLGLRANGTERAIARAIGDKRILLVLDNCEHLLDSVARLVEEIVHRCPSATILATSREFMRVDAESAYSVPPLDVPPQGASGSEHVLRHSAVQLLASRVHALRADFLLTADEYEIAAAICRRLDGIPLALEFAAARSATLGLKHVLSNLDDRFGLLAGGRRSALPRHKTLRATLDWSYQLLSQAQRCLFHRLAVFAGSFDFDAALAIAVGTRDSATASGSIADLVAKSLLIPNGSPTTSRWRMLETVRAFALEKLAASGELDVVARRHADFYVDMFAAPASAPRPRELPGNLDRYALEIDNVRAALDWCFSPRGDPLLGAQLTAAYASIWLRLSLLIECRERTERALEHLRQQPLADAELTVRLAIALSTALLHSIGVDDAAVAVLENALDVAEKMDDSGSQLRALWALWSYQHNRDHRVAQRLAEKFTHIAQGTGNLPDMLVGDRLMGVMAHYAGDQAAARRYVEGVIARYVEPASHRHTLWFHHDQRVLSSAILARILWLQGSLEHADAVAQACFEAAKNSDHNLSLCYVLGEAICPRQALNGDLAAATQSWELLNDIVARHDVGLWKGLVQALHGLIKVKAGAYAEGSALLRTAIDAAGATELMIRKPEFLGILAEGLAGSGHIAEASNTLDEAIALAEADDQLWFLPELLRIKGEILLLTDEKGASDRAERCFVDALIAARLHGALFWELRSTISYARLRTTQNRGAEAREMLASVYGRFSQAFDTPDLQAARTLLAALA